MDTNGFLVDMHDATPSSLEDFSPFPMAPMEAHPEVHKMWEFQLTELNAKHDTAISQLETQHRAELDRVVAEYEDKLKARMDTESPPPTAPRLIDVTCGLHDLEHKKHVFSIPEWALGEKGQKIIDELAVGGKTEQQVNSQLLLLDQSKTRLIGLSTKGNENSFLTGWQVLHICHQSAEEQSDSLEYLGSKPTRITTLLKVVAAVLRQWRSPDEARAFVGRCDVRTLAHQKMTTEWLMASDHVDKLVIDAMRLVEERTRQQNKKRLTSADVKVLTKAIDKGDLQTLLANPQLKKWEEEVLQRHQSRLSSTAPSEPASSVLSRGTDDVDGDEDNDRGSEETDPDYEEEEKEGKKMTSAGKRKRGAARN
jgi:hypothetical protein